MHATKSGPIGLRSPVVGEGGPPGYAVFDVETTGLGERCRIVELAVVVLDGQARVVDRYETLVDSGAGPGPTRIHGITAAMLRDAPAFASVAGDVEGVFRDRVPVAHHLRFDWTVLGRAFAPLGVHLPATVAGVCTAHLSRRLLGGAASLVQVCRRLGIDHPTPHRAGPDAGATVEVFRALRAIEPRLTVGRPCPPFPGAWLLPRSVPEVPRPVSPARDAVDAG